MVKFRYFFVKCYLPYIYHIYLQRERIDIRKTIPHNKLTIYCYFMDQFFIIITHLLTKRTTFETLLIIIKLNKI